MLHAHAERQPPEEPGFGGLSALVTEPETADQLRLFSLGETPIILPELPRSDEELSGDLLGMYFLG